MNWLQGTMIILALFALRLGVPLAITIVAACLLQRLYGRWGVET